MRSDLVLMATVDGEPLEFLARDVPTGVFFFQFQDTFPGAECFARLTAAEQRQNRLGFEAWADGLLCRAMIEPRLTPELVQRIGDAREELVIGYLWGIGYDVPPATKRERLVPPQRVAQPLLRLGGLDEAQPAADDTMLLAVPPPNIRLALRDIAAKARTAPHRIWQYWAISEFIWSWRVAVQDDLKKRAAKHGAGSAQQSDIMDAVGRERS